MGVERREVNLSHTIYHEMREMVGRQAIAKAHGQVECLGVIHCFEGSSHDKDTRL